MRVHKTKTERIGMDAFRFFVGSRERGGRRNAITRKGNPADTVNVNRIKPAFGGVWCFHQTPFFAQMALSTRFCDFRQLVL